MRRATVVASGFSFLEGPRWHDGRLYVSDFYTHRVLAIDERGSVSPICEIPGQPSGLGFAPDGSLLVVSMKDRRLLRLRGSRTEEVADLSGLTDSLCNDMLVDPSGYAYVGNFGWDAAPDAPVRTTSLFGVDASGAARRVADDLIFPNGMALTPDGRTLLVAETFASRITAFDVSAPGVLENRRVWASFAPSPHATVREAVNRAVPLPDGIALDADGALWIGDAAGQAALRIGAGGTVLERIDTSPLAVFAVALGGADRRTLYMCASPPLLSNDPAVEHQAVLLACRVDVPGAGLP